MESKYDKFDDEYAKTLAPRELTLYSLNVERMSLIKRIETMEGFKAKGNCHPCMYKGIEEYQKMLKEHDDLILSIENDPLAYSHIKD